MKKTYAIGIGAVLVIMIIAVIAMLPAGDDDGKTITYDAYCDEVSDHMTTADGTIYTPVDDGYSYYTVDWKIRVGGTDDGQHRSFGYLDFEIIYNGLRYSPAEHFPECTGASYIYTYEAGTVYTLEIAYLLPDSMGLQMMDYDASADGWHPYIDPSSDSTKGFAVSFDTDLIPTRGETVLIDGRMTVGYDAALLKTQKSFIDTFGAVHTADSGYTYCVVQWSLKTSDTGKASMILGFDRFTLSTDGQSYEPSQYSPVYSSLSLHRYAIAWDSTYDIGIVYLMPDDVAAKLSSASSTDGWHPVLVVTSDRITAVFDSALT